MATIKADIQKVVEANNAIKAAIEAKGVDVSDYSKITQAADKILSIQTGLKGHTLTVQCVEDTSTAGKCFLLLIYADGTIQGIDFENKPHANYSYDNVYAYKVLFVHCCKFYLECHSDEYRNYATELPTILDKDETITVTSEFSCLLKGTEITLSDGSVKNIEDVSYEDELLVWDFDNGRLGSSRPSWIKKRQKAGYYFVNRYASGRMLFATGHSDTGWAHRHFDVNRGEFLNTASTVGDLIYTLDGEDRHIACEYVEEECEFYNILTMGHFNLFANGVLTSCRLNNFRKIENMRYVGDLASDRVRYDEFASEFMKLGDARVGNEIIRHWYDALRCYEMPRSRTSELARYAFEREMIKM